MTEWTTPAEREAMRERCEAATPGPWSKDVIENALFYCDEWWFGENGEPANAIHVNAAFIAHAREDMPRLLAENDALAALLALVPRELGRHEKMDDYNRCLLDNERWPCVHAKMLDDIDAALAARNGGTTDE